MYDTCSPSYTARPGQSRSKSITPITTSQQVSTLLTPLVEGGDGMGNDGVAATGLVLADSVNAATLLTEGDDPGGSVARGRLREATGGSAGTDLGPPPKGPTASKCQVCSAI